MKIARYEKAKEWTVDQQLEKISEEVVEFRYELRSNNKSGIIAEGFDIMQAIFTMLDVMGYTDQEIKAHFSLHEQKLQARHENGTLKIKEWMNI